MNNPAARPVSLRWRLLAATLVAMALALGAAGVMLHTLFRDHVLRQFQATLQVHLDQLTGQLEFDAAGTPLVKADALLDPRWRRPYSGLYWQVDREPTPGTSAPAQAGTLRSRSLWDATLQAPTDALADGALHVHDIAGPDGARLLLLERTVRSPATPAAAWRLMVAGDRQGVEQAAAQFSRATAAALAVLALLLAVAAWAQVAIGLAPLRTLQRGLDDLRAGRSATLEGEFPAEIQPLVQGFNGVLARHQGYIERARTQAGNLAHALKTPLAAMLQAAETGDGESVSDNAPVTWRTVVREQVAQAQRQIDWHLARARAAGETLGTAPVPIEPVLAGLLRVMARVHAERGLSLQPSITPDAPAFAGEAQDLQEMLGNLLDNACKWARREVRVNVARTHETPTPQLRITVEDDGPGIAPEQAAHALARGARLDETTPGSGLGLAIVQELARLYGGQVELQRGNAGGLRAVLTLPGAPGAPGTLEGAVAQPVPPISPCLPSPSRGAPQ